MGRDSTLKRVFKIIKKRVKLRTLLILVLTLSVNSFAWFIYANKVDSGIGAKVKAWNVLFEVGEGEAVQNINFDVDQIYPGMDRFSQDVTVTNKGETSASLSYEIVSIDILGDHIEASPTGAITPEVLMQSLRNDYPFKIVPSFSNSVLPPGGSETFNVTVYWLYETGDDEKDTYWGSKAYDYSISNPDDPSIKINLKVMAVQNNE